MLDVPDCITWIIWGALCRGEVAINGDPTRMDVVFLRVRINTHLASICVAAMCADGHAARHSQDHPAAHCATAAITHNPA